MPDFAIPENGVYEVLTRSLPVVGCAIFMELGEEIYVHNGYFQDAENKYFLNFCVDYSKCLLLIEKVDLDKMVREGGARPSFHDWTRQMSQEWSEAQESRVG